jgi:hypothetical protein
MGKVLKVQRLNQVEVLCIPPFPQKEAERVGHPALLKMTKRMGHPALIEIPALPP